MKLSNFYSWTLKFVSICIANTMGFNNCSKLQIRLALVLLLGLLFLKFFIQYAGSLSPSTNLKSFWQCNSSSIFIAL